MAPAVSRAPEHDPLARVEAAVQDAVLARVSGAEPPRAADRAEADVVGDVVGEEALGDQPRRPVVEVRPVPTCPCAGRRRVGDELGLRGGRRRR